MSPGMNELVGPLRKAADVLRSHGVIVYDAAGYVFRLLILKFLSDITDEPPTSGMHQFIVPPAARWSHLRNNSSSGLGDRVNKACAILEEANPLLMGLLREADFNSARLGTRALADLLQTLSALPHLRGDLVSNGRLGEAADSFLHPLAETSVHGYGAFYTPPAVARLMAGLLELREGMRVCDPVCGLGGFLVECARQVSSKSVMDLPHAADSLALYGQEKNAEMWALCRMSLLLHGINNAHIKPGNVLSSPPLTEHGHLLQYDRIVADPPWSLHGWGAEQAAKDAFGRFNPVPPRHNADYAFVQHCVAALAEGGRAALLLPRGVLFRGGAEEDIRRKLLEEDRFEAIIGLPGNLLYDTTIPPVVLVLRKGKPADQRNRVLFIDASAARVKQSRLLRALSQDDINSIVRAFQDFRGDPRYVRAAHLDEIRKLNWNLNIERYVESEEERERFELGPQLDVLAQVEMQRDEAARRMDDAVGKLKRIYPPAS